MNPDNRDTLRVRVVAAAEGVLARQGFVSAIDVLLGVGWLDQATLKRWRQSQLAYLEAGIQRERIREAVSRPPELVVIQPLDAGWTCHRCGGSGDLLIIGALVFLPAGDAGRSRRAKASSVFSVDAAVYDEAQPQAARVERAGAEDRAGVEHRARRVEVARLFRGVLPERCEVSVLDEQRVAVLLEEEPEPGRGEGRAEGVGIGGHLVQVEVLDLLERAQTSSQPPPSPGWSRTSTKVRTSVVTRTSPPAYGSTAMPPPRSGRCRSGFGCGARTNSLPWKRNGRSWPPTRTWSRCQTE
jgi:hypothetical protein